MNGSINLEHVEAPPTPANRGVTGSIAIRHDQANQPPALAISNPLWAGAQLLLDSLECQAAVLNAQGEILAINKRWRDFAISNGGTDPNASLGTSYLSTCKGSESLAKLANAIQDISSGALRCFVMAYDCSGPNTWRWNQVRITRLQGLGDYRILVTHDDVGSSINELGDIWLGYSSLTARERQVFELVSNGSSNKEIATTLLIAEKTVEAHRAAMMRKMDVESVAELVRRAVAIEAAMGGCSLFKQS